MEQGSDQTMEMPLFPLNVVLFPGMALPLHIFEPRYREMINHCIDTKSPFGVVLIREGQETGAAAKPHDVGTAARISRVQRMPDGRMNINTVGTKRFRIESLDYSRAYVTATVSHYPIVNAATRKAGDLMQRVRPKIVEYVAMLEKATNKQLNVNRLPQDPTTLAFMVAMALQINNGDKQSLLELPGIPDMLARESRLLSREIMFMEYMVNTQQEIQRMNMGPTGYIFPN
jgi:Lon protease-like protein